MSEKTDEERVEDLKRLWQQYGTYLIAGLVVLIAGVFGTRAWFDHQQARAEQASFHYQQLIQYAERSQHGEAIAQGRQLLDDFAGTAYAALGAQVMARVEVERGDADSARAHLQWSLANARLAEVRDLARLGLARLQFDANEHDAALTTLRSRENASFSALFDELRGDIHASRGETELAREAYAAALDQSTAQGSRELLQVKYDNL